MIHPQWFEAIAENASEAIIILDKGRIIQYANPAATRMADWKKPADIIGVSYDEILSRSRILDENGNSPDPTTLPTYRAFAEGAESRGVVMEQIYRGVHHWISVTCIPLFDEQGSIPYAVVYFSDVSNRKEAENKLHFLIESSKILSITTDFNTRLREKMRLAVPSLADWATINVTESNGTLARIAIVHRNPSKASLVEELARLSAEEMDSESGIYGVLRSGKPQFTRVVDDAVVGRWKSPNRRVELAHELQVSSSIILPILSHSEVVGVLSFAYAESGRHYTEEDVLFFQEFCNHLGILIDNARLFEEVRKRDLAKDAFLAALSHELRNPLAPIRSHLEILKLKSNDEELQEEVRIVEHLFDHLTRLLNDLLDVSRYTLGKIRLERESISLSATIKHIVKAHEPFMQEKNIALSMELPDQDAQIYADPTRLEQAITNILHNAKKFTPEGGSITIVADIRGDTAAIRVRDSGIGMNRQDIKGVFDINAPMRAARQPGQGLGIGLVLVEQIMELHGGTVEATSEGLGQGSEFVITLPLGSEAYA